LLTLGDMMADSPDRGLAARAVDQLLPVMRGSDKRDVENQVSSLEGIARRLRLPGNKLEMAGTFIDGKPFDWDAYRGKVVLVDFWSTSCPGCIQEIPNIKANLRAYGDKGFEVIGVALENDRQLTQHFMQQVGMTWPQLFVDEPLPTGWAHPLAEKYAVMSIPRAILVDQQGNVVTTMALGRNLGAQLQKLLGPPTTITSSTSAAR
jgi:thiol-disulfide isomerase/thioredoxin